LELEFDEGHLSTCKIVSACGNTYDRQSKEAHLEATVPCEPAKYSTSVRVDIFFHSVLPAMASSAASTQSESTCFSSTQLPSGTDSPTDSRLASNGATSELSNVSNELKVSNAEEPQMTGTNETSLMESLKFSRLVLK